LNENLDEVHHVRSVKEVKVKVSWLLFGVVLPVDSVSHLFLLELSLLFHLVEIYIELLSVENKVVQLVLSESCRLWVLIAHEGIEALFFLGEDLDALNDAKLFKKVFKFFGLGVRGEVLNVEIASLLGVLELGLLLLLFILSVLLLQGFSYIDLFAIELNSIQLFDGLNCGIDSVFFVYSCSIRVLVADESEWSFDFLTWDLHRLHKQTLNISMLAKDLLELYLCPFLREILDVNVVGQLGVCFSLVLGVVVHGDQVCVLCALDCPLNRVSFLKCDESVTKESVFGVDGSFGSLDLAKL
jgi:hypothetical protein